MNPRAKLFIGAICAVGFLTATASALSGWHSASPTRFATYLILAIASAGLRVTLPSVPGTLSAVFVFQFIAIIQMSMAETLVLAWCATLSQNLWMAKSRPTVAQAGFNVATVSLSVQIAFFTFRGISGLLGEWGMLVGLLAAAFIAYIVNTAMVATVIALVEGSAPISTWKANYLWSFPYYLAGGALAGLLSVASTTLGWQTSLLILPVVFLFYRSYTTYTGRLEDAKNHAEEVSALHLRTIESLALAIEAKDDTTHAHLRRVQTYALAIGQDLGLTGTDLAALRAAAILHDIGKLAVPEHIICKPGKLTHEEFEKMKIHPVVGAEILEHVKFPYPVAPIVLSHHEKWNGAGYPYGLKGEEIPIGARILAAVDCLDALASDRQYRKALPIEEAMKVVLAESNKSFDPRIVEILHRRYQELDKAAQAACSDIVKLSTNLKIERGAAPAAGFEESKSISSDDSTDSVSRNRTFISSIAEARLEVQTLFDLSSQLDHSLTVAETLSLVARRLKPIIPHQAVVLWLKSGQHLEAFYAEGANRALFSSLRIPVGEGLAGWVSQNDKSILNGNPAVEPGYLNDNKKFTNLRSALAVPLTGLSDLSGVLAFYDGDRDSFQKDHLRILLGISSKLAICVERSIAASRQDGHAKMDSLTGLPNVQALMERFELELSRAGRSGSPVAVVVCNFDDMRYWNTKLGTQAGDQILREFGIRLKAMFRDYDLTARVGGDEFAVVIPEMAVDDVATRIRQIQLAAMQVGRVVSGDDSVSISVGSSHFPTDGALVEDLLSTADRRMSIAKRQKSLSPAKKRQIPVTRDLAPDSTQAPANNPPVAVS